MKHVVYKLMFDYQKEEKWINEMALKGMNFIDYSIGRYLFEEGRPGEYLYRIELLKNNPRHAESAAYIKFMEELGIECVSTYVNWVYFRKKAADGPFDLFTDCDSKIAHCNRTATIMGIAFTANAVAALINLMIPFVSSGNSAGAINFVCGLISLTIAIILAPIYFSYRGKLKKLLADRQLRE